MYVCVWMYVWMDVWMNVVCERRYFLTRCMLYAVSDEALVYSIIQGLIGSGRDTYFPRSLAQDFAFAKCFHVRLHSSTLTRTLILTRTLTLTHTLTLSLTFRLACACARGWWLSP